MLVWICVAPWPVFTPPLTIPYANIIFDLEREEALPVVHAWLEEMGIVYVGRFGEWGYQWTDEAFKSGERGARKVIERM